MSAVLSPLPSGENVQNFSNYHVDINFIILKITCVVLEKCLYSHKRLLQNNLMIILK